MLVNVIGVDQGLAFVVRQQVFGLLAVDVARQVEVVAVFQNLIERDHSGKLGHFQSFVENVHNFVQILVAQAVFVAVFDEAAAGVNHENTFAVVGIFFV